MKTLQYFLSFLVLSASTACPTIAKELQIFRNDNGFNCLRLDDNLTIAHTTGAQPEIQITHTDFYHNSESITIPVSSIDSCIIKDATVPTLHFTFPDHPDAEWVWDKENYINAVLDIEGCGVVEDASGLSLSVKGRGNSTWSMDKKPMRLKFSKKTSICGFKKAKSYVLLADYLDASMMHNAVGLWLARRLGMQYANNTQPCNVYVNGKYAGLYLLTEKVGINSSSVDIDENTGILFEMSVEYDEKYKFKSPLYNIPVMVKDPDFDELYSSNPSGPTPEERLAIWQEDFNNAELLAATGKGFEAFDLESTVNYLLVISVVCNQDIGFPKSLYMYKERFGEKYKFGPVWDLDVTFNFLRGTSNSPADNPSTLGHPVETPPTTPIWISGILGRLGRENVLKEAYKAKFEEFDATIYPEMMEFIDEYAKTIEAAAKMDGARWPEEFITTWCYRTNSFDRQKQVTALKNWLEARMEYLRPRAAQGIL